MRPLIFGIIYTSILWKEIFEYVWFKKLQADYPDYPMELISGEIEVFILLS
jgi:hypothetical protein